MYNPAHYPVVMYWSEEDQAYLVEVPDLPGCLADGPTQAEAIANSRVIIQEWLAFAQETGRIIPAPSERLRMAA
ncbi:type II toxin-antitoxin system HicB family antitoxin [Hymenobacter psoromatis]|uniref:type II toxin-antitoxin system HicB family antitoxin n=2 Tax=Hymenobacter psoromatis TaxID=1484116 RepID=UPI001CBD97C4